jgi:hypothetical protein
MNQKKSLHQQKLWNEYNKWCTTHFNPNKFETEWPSR